MNSESTPKQYNDDDTPPNRLESGPKGPRKKCQVDSDLFNTITKTIDTRIVTVKDDEDDEIRLMELKKGKDEASIGGSTKNEEDTYDGYKRKHQANLPTSW